MSSHSFKRCHRFWKFHPFVFVYPNFVVTFFLPHFKLSWYRFFAFILAQEHNKKREQEVDIEIHEKHKELTNYHCFLQWLKKWNVDAKLQTKNYWRNVKLGNTALQTYWYCFTSWLYHCHILRLFNELYFTISKTRFVFICYIPTYKKGRRGNSMRCNFEFVFA